jgi:hypothetical protein
LGVFLTYCFGNIGLFHRILLFVGFWIIPIILET